MSEEYQSGSYYSYNSGYLNTKQKHTQNGYQKTAGGLTVFLVLLGIAAIVCAIISGVLNGNIKTLRHEYINYINMITRATISSEYSAEAEITGRYYDTEYDAYYLTYEIDYHFFFDPIKGETPALFDLDDLNSKYRVGDTIKVALSDKFENISKFTDSIIMDLQYIELDDYLDYEDTEDAQEVTKILSIVFASVALILVVVIISLYIKGKKVKQKKQTTTTTTANNNSTTTTNNSVICAYCGSHMGHQSKCPNCGAGRK